MVSLQSFEHFDVISMVDDSTGHGKLFSICFFIVTLTLLTSITVEVSRKISRERKSKTTITSVTGDEAQF